jgi:Ribbon-helix-helix protein, copG family
MKARIVQFTCPVDLLQRIDEIAREEMLSRADVCRRALAWEVRAVVGDGLQEAAEAPQAG